MSRPEDTRITPDPIRPHEERTRVAIRLEGHSRLLDHTELEAVRSPLQRDRDGEDRCASEMLLALRGERTAGTTYDPQCSLDVGLTGTGPDR